MAIADDIEAGVAGVLAPAWETRNGTVVPKTEDIALKNGAVLLDATYAYADLADSSSLGQKVDKEVAAKVIRAYLNAAVRILRHYNGHIRSFDGDRAMAVFIGDSKNSNAVRAALALSWAVTEVLKPKLKAKWSNLSAHWTVGHGVGIDTGQAMLVRGGVRNNNDLVSIGAAPNVAAKLSSLRNAGSIYITKAVYERAQADRKTSADGRNMWSNYGTVTVGGNGYTVYSSTWHWKP